MTGENIRDDDDLFFDDEFILDDGDEAANSLGSEADGDEGANKLRAELDEAFDETEAELGSGLSKDLDFDDGTDFVLDDEGATAGASEDEDNEFFLEEEHAAAAPAADGGLNLDFSVDPGQAPLDMESAEGVLFGETTPGEHQFERGDERTFKEEAGRGWGGNEVDLAHLGLEGVDETADDGPSLADAEELREADETAMEIDEDAELELVEYETDLDQSKAETAAYVLDEGEEGPGEGWEPPAALDGDEAEAAYLDGEEAEQELAVGEDPDYSEYEEGYVEDGAMAGAAVGAPRPRSRFRSMMALAATLLVIGSLGVAWYKPELYLGLLGSKPETVDVTKVDRPDVKIETPAPQVEIDKPDVPELNPDVPDVKPDVPDVKPDVPDVKPDVPDVKPDVPDVKPDYPQPDIAKPDVRRPVSPRKPPTKSKTIQAVPLDETDRIPIGEGDGGYMKGGRVDMSGMRRSPSRIREQYDLVMGSKALAQLKNNNIFIGRIKAIDSAHVTLNVDGGEVSLDLEQVRVLTHLAFEEFQNLRKKGRDGYVYLRNNNRLKGLIVAERDDSVILQVQSNRVIIPKSAIEQIKDTKHKQVQFSEDDSIEKDDWVRKLVEQQIRERVQKTPKGRVKIDPNANPTPPNGR